MGRYQEGVDILADLFIESQQPAYIFNQARCFQQNHRWESALDRFREYQRKAGELKASDRAEIEKYMRECEGHLDKTASAPSPSPAAPPSPAITAVPVSPVSAPPTVSVTPNPVVVDESSGLRTWGILTGVTGLVGVGAGIFCSVKTYSLRDDESRLNSYKTAGIVSYAVGGAALVTSAVLFIVNGARKDSAEGAMMVFVPDVHPRGASVLLRGRF